MEDNTNDDDIKDEKEKNDHEVVKDKFFELNGKQLVKRTIWTKGGTEFMNGVQFTTSFSFGCQQSMIKQNIYMITDNQLIYLCGKHIVMYDIKTKQQKFLLKHLEDEEVTAMNFYQSQVKTNLWVAVGLKHKDKVQPQVKIYKSSKSYGATLSHVHLQTLGNNVQGEIIDLCFLFKTRNVITLTRTNDKQSAISIFRRKEEKLLEYKIIKDELKRIIPSGMSLDEFLLVGARYLKLWHFSEIDKVENQLNDSPISLNQFAFDEEIIDSCFIPGTPYLAVVTNINNIHFMKKDVHLQILKIEIPLTHLLEFEDKNNYFKTEKMTEQEKMIFYSQEENLPAFLVSCICPVKNGYAISFSGISIVMVYLIDQEKNILKNDGIFTFKTNNIFRINNIYCSQDDKSIVLSAQHMDSRISILMDQPQIKEFIKQWRMEEKQYSKKMGTNRQSTDQMLVQKNYEKIPKQLLGRTDLYLLQYGNRGTDDIVLRNPFIPIFQKGVHRGAILSIVSSPSQSIFATICEDKQVKIWYFNHFKSQFACIYSVKLEQPLSISLHPLSIQCAIGFKESIKFYFLQNNELKQVYQDTIRACNAVQYSKGGHILAAANLNVINLYNPCSFDLICTLQGIQTDKGQITHTGFIKNIKWIDQDKMIVSQCSEGKIICTNINPIQNHLQHTCNKELQYTAAEYDLEYDLILACTYDQRLQVFTNKGQTQHLEINIYDQGQNYYFTQILIIKELNVVLLGTSAGSIRMYMYPIDKSVNQQEFSDTAVHQGAVTSIAVTPDLNFLITGSEDGSVYFLKMREYMDGHELIGIKGDDQQVAEKRLKINSSIYYLNFLTISSGTLLQLLNDKIKELEFRIQNLNQDKDEESDRLKDLYNQQIFQISEQYKDQIETQRKQIQEELQKLDSRNKDLQKKIMEQRQIQEKALKKQEQDDIDELLNHYKVNDFINTKMNKEIKKIQEELENQKSIFENETQKEEDEEQKNLQNEEYNYTKAISDQELDKKKEEENMEQVKQEFQMMKDNAIKKLNSYKNEAKITDQEQKQLNSNYNKNIEVIKQRIFDRDLKVKELEFKVQQMEDMSNKLETRRLLVLSKLEGNEDTIKVKETQIKKYRKQNMHLQNFKEVYDYRQRLLQEERLPLTDHVQDVNKNIKILYQQLLSEANDATQLQRNLTDSQQQIEQLKKQYHQKRDLVIFSQRQIQLFSQEVHDMLQFKPVNDWSETLIEIQMKYFEKNKIQNFLKKNKEIGIFIHPREQEKQIKNLILDTDELMKEELLKQRDHLSKKGESQTIANKDKEKERDDKVLKYMNENTNLINKCNILRQEKQQLIEKIEQGTLDLEQIRLEIDQFEIENKQPVLENDLSEYFKNKEIQSPPRQIIKQNQFDNNMHNQVSKIRVTPYQIYQFAKERLVTSQSPVDKAKVLHRTGSASPQKKGSDFFITQLIQEASKFKVQQNQNMYKPLENSRSSQFIHKEQNNQKDVRIIKRQTQVNQDHPNIRLPDKLGRSQSPRTRNF